MNAATQSGRHAIDLRNLTVVGFLTLLIIAIPTLTAALRHNTLSSLHTTAWIAAILAFAVAFAICAWRDCSPRLRLALVALQTILALACIALEPNGLTGILLVIVAAQLGTMPVAVGLSWLVAQSAVLLFIIRGSGEALTLTTAYFAFQLFSLFAVRIAHTEADMRVALAAANTELKVTTGLLEINSRSEERLRISRDLHDLIGHHLTALTLNLEVASHLAGGDAREQIEKSKALAKLLLSDVRDVVSRLRENEPVDLRRALDSLRDVVGRPAVHLDIESLSLTSAAVGETALRIVQEIVTNAVRHSNAENLWLRVATVDGGFSIDARDDGIGTDAIHVGNGLRGMRERAEERGGLVELKSARRNGFEVHVRIPASGAQS